MTQEALNALLAELRHIHQELESIDGRLYELVEASKAQEIVIQLDGKELARAVTKHQSAVIRTTTEMRRLPYGS